MAAARVSGSGTSVVVGTKAVAAKATLVLYLKALGHLLALIPSDALRLSEKGGAHLAGTMGVKVLTHARRKRIWKRVRGVRKAGRAAWKWSLSPEGKAAFAGFAAGIMLVSGVPGQLHVQPAVLGGIHNLLSGTWIASLDTHYTGLEAETRAGAG